MLARDATSSTSDARPMHRRPGAPRDCAAPDPGPATRETEPLRSVGSRKRPRVRHRRLGEVSGHATAFFPPPLSPRRTWPAPDVPALLGAPCSRRCARSTAIPAVPWRRISTSSATASSTGSKSRVLTRICGTLVATKGSRFQLAVDKRLPIPTGPFARAGGPVGMGGLPGVSRG